MLNCWVTDRWFVSGCGCYRLTRESKCAKVDPGSTARLGLVQSLVGDSQLVLLEKFQEQ